MNDWRRDEATNQTRFRDLNESIAAMTDDLGALVEPDAFVCECSDADCTALIRLTRAEYEVVRGEATHFAIAIDHENPEMDRVVVEHRGYAIVQKVPAYAVRIARETDPRRQVAPSVADGRDDGPRARLSGTTERE